jgi:cold shock CspA family protein
MPNLSLSTLLIPILSLLPYATAHGAVHGIVVDGQWYPGWDAAMRYQNPIPAVAGWQADNLDNGFISPSSFGSPDIVCHKSAKNGNAYVTARPGSKVQFQWNTWPASHKGSYISAETCGSQVSGWLISSQWLTGPVFDYIAPCNGDCTTVDKTKLLFTKFNEGAWISGNDPGTWVCLASHISPYALRANTDSSRGNRRPRQIKQHMDHNYSFQSSARQLRHPPRDNRPARRWTE